VGLCVIIFILSIILNIVLMAAIPGRIETGLAKSTIRDGVDDQIVAVYNVQDVIDDEAARRFEEFHREIIRDHMVKAVLLRIDSPGGGVAASDQIHSLVVDLRKRGKKVVVSMGSMATSGAYYIAAPADCIVAEETTITGSIGVIMGWMVLRGTLEKIGVESVIIKSRNAEGWKDEISPFRQPDPRQRAHLQALLDDMQKRFEHVVREGRGEKLMTRVERYTVKVGEGETVHEEQRTDLEPFNGKVYLSDEARELGLVDEIGYLERAIDLARQLAAAPRAKVVVYRAYKSFLQRMLEARSGQSLQLDARLLDRLQSPQIMLMWKAD
jgi:protease-4